MKSSSDTEQGRYATSDQYEGCEECGGPIDTYDAGYYKTPDERFKHALCHETGDVPEQYKLVESTESDTYDNKQYNCGHTIYAPPIEHPMFCPICNDLGVEVREIGSDTEHSEGPE